MKGMSGSRSRRSSSAARAAEPRHRVVGNREIPRPAVERRRERFGRLHALEDDRVAASGQRTDHDAASVFRRLNQEHAQWCGSRSSRRYRHGEAGVTPGVRLTRAGR